MNDMKQWYHDDDLERDRTHVMEDPIKYATGSEAQYVVLKGNRGVFHTTTALESDKRTIAEPLFLSYQEIQSHFGENFIPDMIHVNEQQKDYVHHDSVLIWVGNRDKTQYWALYLAPDDHLERNGIHVQSILEHVLKARHVTNQNTTNSVLFASPLREFGDVLQHVEDAGVLATANGLCEFHKSHGYCAKCGARTTCVMMGGARSCIACNTKVYPRIDVAAIMLITSPCRQYGLLGRKSMWPRGRYSTLAGFVEVGETLEQCCIREVFEESGVRVDPSSVEFVCSQPWPFPKSLMVGFRGVAIHSERQGDDESSLPRIETDLEEMEHVEWFHKDYVAARLEGGSTALGYEPPKHEEEFHIPGRASLARILITQWATKHNYAC